MSDENDPNAPNAPEFKKNQNGYGYFTSDHFEPEPPKDKTQADKLEHLLSSVERGWKIAIVREQPGWCRGHLETYEVYDPSEEGGTIDVEYLIRTWGGQRLHIKVHDETGKWIGGGSLSLFSYPPKVRGHVITEQELYGYITGPTNPTQPHPNAAYYPPPHTAAPAPSLDIGRLIDMITKNKNTDTTTLLKVLEFATTRQPQTQLQPQPYAPVGQPQNMTEQMLATLQLFKEMKDVFGAAQLGSSDGGDNMAPVLAEIVRGLTAQREGSPQTTGRLSPPRSQQPPLSLSSSQQTHPPRAPTQPAHETLGDMANKLAGLSAQDAADVVMQAIGAMPEEKRSVAMGKFLEQMNEDMADDMADETLENPYEDPDNVGINADSVSSQHHAGKYTRR